MGVMFGWGAGTGVANVALSLSTEIPRKSLNMGNVRTHKRKQAKHERKRALPPPAPPCAAAAYMSKSALRHRRLYEQMYAVPATAGHSFGVGCLHPVLDGGKEPLEAKVREDRNTLF